MLILLSSIILISGNEVGELMEDKEYNDALDKALHMLKIFKKLSYEDKLRVIGITEGLLISQENSKSLSDMFK